MSSVNPTVATTERTMAMNGSDCPDENLTVTSLSFFDGCDEDPSASVASRESGQKTPPHFP
jgi:hypothetical protein